MASNTFVSAGAGPHCPQTYDTDSSLIQRGSRTRISRTKVSALRVLGRHFGSHVLSALRMAFKSYEPAVALTQQSLRGPSWGKDGVEMERFAHDIMDSGEVDRAEDLPILCEVLNFAHEVLEKVLSRETEVKHYLPAQKAAEFAPNGPVMSELRKVMEELEKLEEEYQAENEVLAAEFDADSFRLDNTTSSVEENLAGAKEVQVEATSNNPGELGKSVKKRPGELGEPVKKMSGELGEPEKKRSRSSLEVYEDVIKEAGGLTVEETPPWEPSVVSNVKAGLILDQALKKPAALNKTLAEAGAAALDRFQK